MTDARGPSVPVDGSAEAVQSVTARDLLRRRRSTLTVTIDLDPVPGWGNEAEDHRALVQRLLDDAVGHYHPHVEIAP